jgi:hypothetical protein
MVATLDRRKAYEIAQAVEFARRKAAGSGTGLRGPLGAEGLPAHPNPTQPAGAPSRTSGTILNNSSGAALRNASLLAALNRMDREIVDAGTAFGKKHGIDTGFGIMFGDRRRFNRIDPDVILGKAPPKVTQAERERALLKLSNLQSLYGKPMGITDAMSPRESLTSQHMVDNAFDTSVPGGIPEKARVAELTAQLGFGGIGAAYPDFPNMVHVDTRPLDPRGPMQWGPRGLRRTAPKWQRDAIARGFGSAPDWDATAAANARSPLGLAEALAAMNSR